MTFHWPVCHYSAMRSVCQMKPMEYVRTQCSNFSSEIISTFSELTANTPFNGMHFLRNNSKIRLSVYETARLDFITARSLYLK